jgi:hypothetical protein
MTITRALAAAAMLAGLAVGTASIAWADTTMSGHYIMTETAKVVDRSSTIGISLRAVTDALH